MARARKQTRSSSGREALRKNGMMAHLLDSLDAGQDIGHYGRLVFAMVARHFLDEDELRDTLQQDPAFDERQAISLIEQVKGRDYSPPRREKVLQFQAQQEFPICPNADDPDACNVYKDLQFPESVYEHIGEYREQKAHAHEDDAQAAGSP
jgi:DNA primase large subunit